MTKRQKLWIVIVSLAVVLALTIGAFAVRHTSKKQPVSTSKKTVQKSVSAKPAKGLVAPTSHTVKKVACDLFSNELATKTVGQGAVKNEKLTAFRTPDYSSTICEYAASNKKATVTLYEYPSADKAKSDMANVQNQQFVAEDGGKKTSVQPKTSAAEAKDVFVVTVTVTNSDKFDPDSSNQLLKDLIGKL